MAGAEDTDYLVGSRYLASVDHTSGRLGIISVIDGMFGAVGIDGP